LRILVGFSLDDFELVGRVSAVRTVPMGMEYDIYMDMTGAHLFDLDTGVRVCSGTAPEKMETRLGLKAEPQLRTAEQSEE